MLLGNYSISPLVLLSHLAYYTSLLEGGKKFKRILENQLLINFELDFGQEDN